MKAIESSAAGRHLIPPQGPPQGRHRSPSVSTPPCWGNLGALGEHSLPIFKSLWWNRSCSYRLELVCIPGALLGTILLYRLAALLLVAALLGVAAAIAEPTPIEMHTNGLGMRFVPVPGTKVWFSIYQTRVQDFQVFIKETGYVHMRENADPDSRMWSLDKDGNKQRGNSWADPGFEQKPDHPVVGVSWNDAKAFCEWLTLRERAAGRLPKGREYRLPTDAEWSVAVGLEEEDPRKTPQEKDAQVPNKFPWGKEWPPPAGRGNFAGEEARDDHWPSNIKVIEGYRDGFARTAPVGSFKPNRYGLFDLGSNVVEWCEDLYAKDYPYRVLRGASWSLSGRDDLLSSDRDHGQSGNRNGIIGFRCVEGLSTP